MHSTFPDTVHNPTEFLTESEVAARLKTTVASVRWMRRTGRIGFVKIAGNRKVRFLWPQVLEDLRAAEVRATAPDNERARQGTQGPAIGGSSADNKSLIATSGHGS
jgi:hypothetical protein